MSKHTETDTNGHVEDEALLLDLSDEDNGTVCETLEKEEILKSAEQEIKKTLKADEILKLHFEITETVKKYLHRYYKQKLHNSNKYVIKDKAEFSFLAKDFCDKFRDDIKKRYFVDRKTLKGIAFKDLDNTYIKNKIGLHFNNLFKEANGK